jgi:hypothetical protein
VENYLQYYQRGAPIIYEKVTSFKLLNIFLYMYSFNSIVHIHTARPQQTAAQHIPDDHIAQIMPINESTSIKAAIAMLTCPISIQSRYS